MKISDAVYVGSYGHSGTFPRGLGVELAFVGRSNVGKSSLINSLLGRRKLAKTSNTPGKTRAANYYRINNAFCFVDMPGYGYAKVSRTERARWRKIITKYLKERKPLGGIVVILDGRHPPTVEDREWVRTVRSARRPFCIVFNKIDKLRSDSISRHISRHLQALALDDGTAVVPYSAVVGRGRGELWAWIRESLSL